MSRLDRLVRAVVESPQCLRTLWRAMFCDNSLLRREMGLWEGRPLWKTPIVWAVVVGLITLAMRVGRFIWDYTVLTRIQGGLQDPGVGQAHINHYQSLASRLVFQCMNVVGILFVLTIIWLVARAWGRDRNEAMRNQIGATPITVPQLIGARTLIWLAIPLIFFLLSSAQSIIEILIGALMAPRDSLYFLTRFGRAYLDQLSPWQQILQIVLATGIDFFRHAAWWLMMLGLTTRITLVSFRPALTLVIVAAIGVVLNLMGSGIVYLLFGMGSRRLIPVEMLWHIFGWGKLLLLALAAFFVWRGLPAHVARVYGKG